jgi:hypothetical protein
VDNSIYHTSEFGVEKNLEPSMVIGVFITIFFMMLFVPIGAFFPNWAFAAWAIVAFLLMPISVGSITMLVIWKKKIPLGLFDYRPMVGGISALAALGLIVFAPLLFCFLPFGLWVLVINMAFTAYKYLKDQKKT